MAEADPTTLAELAAGNRAYEERFGHVFLICATGRSAPELLAALRERGLGPGTEEPDQDPRARRLGPEPRREHP